MGKYVRNTGKPWGAREIAQFRSLAAGNTPVHVIGLRLGRSHAAVRRKASEEGVSLRNRNQRPYGAGSRRRRANAELSDWKDQYGRVVATGPTVEVVLSGAMYLRHAFEKVAGRLIDQVVKNLQDQVCAPASIARCRARTGAFRAVADALAVLEGLPDGVSTKPRADRAAAALRRVIPLLMPKSENGQEGIVRMTEEVRAWRAVAHNSQVLYVTARQKHLADLAAAAAAKTDLSWAGGFLDEKK